MRPIWRVQVGSYWVGGGKESTKKTRQILKSAENGHWIMNIGLQRRQLIENFCDILERNWTISWILTEEKFPPHLSLKKVFWYCVPRIMIYGD